MGFHHTTRPPRVVALGGPVTRALRTMRTADAEHRAEIKAERARVRALRRAIADRIEADIALLDTLDAITEDLEDGGDLEPSLGSINPVGPEAFGVDGRPLPYDQRSYDQRLWSGGSTDDREDGDDTGVADGYGLGEQVQRFLEAGGDLHRVRAA